MWEKPKIVEVKMDAEIGSYQVDDPPIAKPASEEATIVDREED